MMVRILLVAACLAAVGGAAHAGAPDALRAAVFRSDAPQSARPAAVTYAEAPAARPAGIAKTSLDHAFDKRATGSVGFLCGLDERLDSRGAMGAYGTDPQGRFVGAKLRLTFR